MKKLFDLVEAFFKQNDDSEPMIENTHHALKRFVQTIGAKSAYYYVPQANHSGQKLFSYPKVEQSPCSEATLAKLSNQSSVCDWLDGDEHYFGFKVRTFGCLVVAFTSPVQSDIATYIPVLLPLFTFYFDYQSTYTLKRTLFNENAMYKTILDSIPDLISFKTVDGVYQFVNQAARKHYNLTLAGKTIDEIYSKDDAEIVRQLDAEALKHNHPVRRNIEVMTKDGYVKVDSIRAQVRDLDGQLQGIVSISRDQEAVEKHEAELNRFYSFQKMLAQLASQFINVAPAAEDAAVDKALRMTGEFVGVDRVYVFLYDFAHDMIEYRYEWCAPSISPEIDNLRFMTISDFQTDWVDLHLKDQEVIIENVANLPHDSKLYETLSIQDIQSLITLPLFNDDECLGFVGFDDVRSVRTWQEEERRLLKFLAQIITNLLVRKRQSEALVQSKQAAERANQAKSLFVASISHDIRTPLAIMQNVTELLKMREQPAHNLEYLGILNAALESLAGLVSNVIDLSKIEAGMITLEQSSFNLEQSMFKLIKMQEQSASDNGLSLDFVYDNTLSNQVIFDENRLGRIINNLLSNAIKFTPKGTVILRVTRLSEEDGHAQVQFAVDDHARAITEAEKSMIADRFYRGKEDVGIEGTGLGLSIVVEMLKLFDTALEIERHNDQGNRFSFKLTMPLSDQPNPASHQPYRNHFAIALGKPNAEMRRVQHAWETLGFTFIEDINPIKQPLALCLISEPLTKKETALLNTCQARFIHQVVSSHAFDDAKIYSDFQTTALVTPHFLYEMFAKVTSEEPTINGLQPGPKDKKVLYVEDNPLSRQTMQEILENRGYTVQTATHAEAAFALLEQTTFDTILMDVQLPGMDGFEALKQIRARGGAYETMPIFMLTAHALQEDIDRFQEGGATDVLTKPFGIQHLINTIEGRPIPHLRHKTSLAIPKNIPIFDESAFYAQYKDLMETGLLIIETYLEHAPRDIANIIHAFEQRDFPQVAYFAHYFKSSCAYTGAARMAFLCKLIDDAAKEKKVSLIQSTLSSLKDVYESTKKILTDFLALQKR